MNEPACVLCFFYRVSGYTAAQIFALWFPGSELNERGLHDNLNADANAGLLNANYTGVFCGDQNHASVPLMCIGKRDATPGCSYRRSITVHSFEAQLGLYQDTAQVIPRKYPHLTPEYKPDPAFTRTKATWMFHNLAVTDKVDPANPFGYFTETHLENGHLVKLAATADGKVPEGYKLVKLTTIDSFCAAHNISRVDVLKIDAEGGDLDVIRGANITLLHRHVKMLSVECFNCLKDLATLSMVDRLHKEYGFSCYSAGWSTTLVRLTDCNNPELAKGDGEHASSANVYCAPVGSRLYHSFQYFSLYRYASSGTGGRGDFVMDALLNNNSATIRNGKAVLNGR